MHYQLSIDTRACSFSSYFEERNENTVENGLILIFKEKINLIFTKVFKYSIIYLRILSDSLNANVQKQLKVS